MSGEDWVKESDRLSTDVPPVLLIRLSPSWLENLEELEPGYFRKGCGWRVDMTPNELVDSTRGWWRFSPESANSRGVQHAVAVVNGRTRALMTIDEYLVPRDDGRIAFTARLIESGPLFESIVGAAGKSVDFAPGSSNPVTYWPPMNRRLLDTAANPLPNERTTTQVEDIQVAPLPPPTSPAINTQPQLPPPQTAPATASLPDTQSESSHKSVGILEAFRFTRAISSSFQRLQFEDRICRERIRRSDLLVASLATVNWNSKTDETIASLTSCRLTEPRKGAAVREWKSSSSGRSYSGVRLGGFYVGGSSGSTSSGRSVSYPPPDQLQEIDQGRVHVTTDRISFIGSMFTYTTTREKLAGWEARDQEVLFAPLSGKKVWIVRVATPDHFLILVSALIVWDRLHEARANGSPEDRSSLGPKIAQQLANELRGDSASRQWNVRRAVRALTDLADSLAQQRPLVLKSITRALSSRTEPQPIDDGQLIGCWSCGRPFVIGFQTRCDCGADTDGYGTPPYPLVGESVNEALLQRRFARDPSRYRK